VTSKRLDAALSEHAAKVFAKVRVADILPIEGSGVTSEDYRFALQAHFDFLVSDGEHHPLFAVEVDGPQHATPEQAARDGRKDSLCERFDFPILRINAKWLKEQYLGFSLLAWFVEVWFAAKEFERQQAAGIISKDEPFDPTFFVTMPGRDRSFPLMLSAGPCSRVRNLWFQGKVRDPWPSFLIGRDHRQTYRAIGWLMVTDDAGVLARTAMRLQRFPVREWEALREIIPFGVERRLNSVLGRRRGTSRQGQARR
jgi:Protein of unknown function (DUF2726)